MGLDQGAPGELRLHRALERRAEYPDDEIVDVLEIVIERLAFATHGIGDVHDAYAPVGRGIRDQAHERGGEFVLPGILDAH